MIKLLSVVFLLWYPKAANNSSDQSDSDFNSINLDSETRSLLWKETFGLDLTNLPSISAVGLKNSQEVMNYHEAKKYCMSFGDNDEYQLPGLYSNSQKLIPIKT